jgi:hypothetical protein
VSGGDGELEVVEVSEMGWSCWLSESSVAMDEDF